MPYDNRKWKRKKNYISTSIGFNSNGKVTGVKSNNKKKRKGIYTEKKYQIKRKTIGKKRTVVV